MAEAAALLPEIALPSGALILGDLHLDLEGDSSAVPAFARWCGELRGCPRLVILGDLFEVWLGRHHAELPASRAVLSALAALVERGCEVEVLHGNRDFLLGPAFERATGARVHARGLVGRLPGPGGEEERRVLLVHGDELCTLDRGYQRLKRRLRSAPVRWLAPRLPSALAREIARRLRRAAVQVLEQKPSETTAQQPLEVLALAGRHGCGVLVCGHAHRYRDEVLARGGRGEAGVRWIVVAAFGTGRDLVRVRPDGDLETVEGGPGGPRA